MFGGGGHSGLDLECGGTAGILRAQANLGWPFCARDFGGGEPVVHIRSDSRARSTVWILRNYLRLPLRRSDARGSLGRKTLANRCQHLEEVDSRSPDGKCFFDSTRCFDGSYGSVASRRALLAL